MKKPKNKKVSHLDYFGITKVFEGDTVPNDSYVITRKGEGTWLLNVSRVGHDEMIHVGTVDLRDILCVAEKSHMGNLRKDEFYEGLNKILNLDLCDKLYAMPDVAKVFNRVTSYSKDVAKSEVPYGKLVQDFNEHPCQSYRSQVRAISADIDE